MVEGVLLLCELLSDQSKPWKFKTSLKTSGNKSSWLSSVQVGVFHELHLRVDPWMATPWVCLVGRIKSSQAVEILIWPVCFPGKPSCCV
jgi:hypothetical protein